MGDYVKVQQAFGAPPIPSRQVPVVPSGGVMMISSGIRNNDINAHGDDVIISGGIVNGSITNATNVYLRGGVLNGDVHCRRFHHESGIMNGEVYESAK